MSDEPTGDGRNRRPLSGLYVVLWRDAEGTGRAGDWRLAIDPEDGVPVLFEGDATKAMRSAASAHPDIETAVRRGACQLVAVPAASWRPITTHLEQPPPIVRFGAESPTPAEVPA
jgi:hypothetical protein